MKTNIKYAMAVLLLWLMSGLLSGCEEFLDKKSSQNLTIPETLNDAQAMIDYAPTMNSEFSQVAEISSDDYFLSDVAYNAMSRDYDKAAYMWAPYEVFGGTPNQWASCYNGVNTANLVIDLVERKSDGSPAWSEIKGRALVFRGVRFLDAAFTHCPAYDGSSAGSALGIPLRTSPDFNLRSVRSSVAQTYAQVISDLKAAVPLLPALSTTVIRPSRCAAYGLLARTYLAMRDYEQATLYADSALRLKSSLIDYNTLRATDGYPIKEGNAECILFLSIKYTDPLNISRARIVPELTDSYATDDLRRQIFFTTNADGTRTFKGGYAGNQAYLFSLNTDELLLIRAEGNARAGRTDLSLADLNRLLANRWRAGTFRPLTTTEPQALLTQVLIERRKELLMRGLRWPDIKRLNLEGRQLILRRMINGVMHELHPNDPRYAIALPADVIALSGMPQNPR